MKQFEKYYLLIATLLISALIHASPTAGNALIAPRAMPLLIVVAFIFVPFALRWALKKPKKD